MSYTVDIVQIESSQIAAVRSRFDRSRLSSLIVSSLDQVYAFLATAPDLTRGHNVVIYDGQGHIEAGVQVEGSFTGEGNVIRSATPDGRTARALHRGPYAEIGSANEAILVWCREHRESPTGISWEVYGDWEEAEADLTAEIFYQLAAPT